jgi:hypothetical protein
MDRQRREKLRQIWDGATGPPWVWRVRKKRDQGGVDIWDERGVKIAMVFHPVDFARNAAEWWQAQEEAEANGRGLVLARTAVAEACEYIDVLERALEMAAFDARRYMGQSGSMEKMTPGGYKYKARKELSK